MLAYNRVTFRNQYVREQAEDALQYNCISAEQFKTISEAHPVDLYSPNVFVRIGLGLLTIVIILLSTGLFTLLFELYNSIEGLMIFFGFLCYILLEVMAKKKHYNSGVDTILIISVVCFIVGGIAASLNSSQDALYPQIVSLCAFIICTGLAIRFANSLMGIAAVISLLVFVFFSYVRLGPLAAATVPFVLIAFSMLIYFVSHKLGRSPARVFYHNVFSAIDVVALLAIYFSGNYFVLSEINHEVFYPMAQTAVPVSFGWFFWVWTIVVPVIYMVKGIKDKDPVMIRVGLLIVAVAVITFRYYYAVFTTEAAITIAGMLVVLVAYSIIRYLREPRYGYTFKETGKNKEGLANLEGIIISEAFGDKGSEAARQDTKFGGGSFGGAGAGDNY